MVTLPEGAEPCFFGIWVQKLLPHPGAVPTPLDLSSLVGSYDQSAFTSLPFDSLFWIRKLYLFYFNDFIKKYALATQKLNFFDQGNYGQKLIYTFVITSIGGFKLVSFSCDTYVSPSVTLVEYIFALRIQQGNKLSNQKWW